MTSAFLGKSDVIFGILILRQQVFVAWHLSHNVYCKKYDPCKALQYQFEPDFVYCTYKLRSSSVQERSVYTAFAEEKNIFILIKMESLYDMFAAISTWFWGEFERNFFRLPGYFELSRVLEWGSLSIRAHLRVV
jgi:hypothetical protein